MGFYQNLLANFVRIPKESCRRIPLAENGNIPYGERKKGFERVELEPGESKRIVFTMGYGKNPRDQKFLSPGIIRKDTAKRLCGKFADPAAVDAALAELGAYWDKMLGNNHI